jgi:hypothetical protein
LNSGPFPRPELPGFVGTAGLSATPAGPACPSRASGCGPLTRTAWGFPCCVGSPLRTCRRQYPGGTAGSDRSWDGLFQPFPSHPAASAFPGSMAGRLPHHCFRGLLGVHSRCGLPARGATLWPFASKAPAVSLPPPPLRLLPAGATAWPTILQTRCSTLRLPFPGHVFEIALAEAVSQAEPRGRAGTIRG